MQQDVFDDGFDALWESGPAVRVALATPLPAGFLELSATALSFDAARAGLPRIRAVGTALGWGADLGLPSRMTLRGAVRTGVWWMLFDDTAALPAQDENELSFGVRASLRRRFADRWSFEVGAEAVRVLTEPDLEFVFAGAGIARTFDMPQWLREGLQ